MKPGETGCLGVVAFRFTNSNLRWMDCAHVWCRSIDPPCSFSSVRSCAFTKPFTIESVTSYVMECPEARMLLIMLITFASISLGNNGLAPRGRFGNFESSSYLSLFSLLYALTMFLTVDSGTPNFVAAGRLPFTIAHLAISACLNSS